jgi:hypothetical protein
MAAGHRYIDSALITKKTSLPTLTPLLGFTQSLPSSDYSSDFTSLTLSEYGEINSGKMRWVGQVAHRRIAKHMKF